MTTETKTPTPADRLRDALDSGGPVLHLRDDLKALLDERDALREAQAKWLLSPEAAKRLDGYRELAAKCAALEAECDGEAKAAEVVVLKLDRVERERDELRDALKWERVAFEDRRVRLEAAEAERDQLAARVSVLTALLCRTAEVALDGHDVDCVDDGANRQTDCCVAAKLSDEIRRVLADPDTAAAENDARVRAAALQSVVFGVDVDEDVPRAFAATWWLTLNGVRVTDDTDNLDALAAKLNAAIRALATPPSNEERET